MPKTSLLEAIATVDPDFFEGLDTQEAIQEGMEEKAQEFTHKGAQVYAAPDPLTGAS